ncbi:MAG: valine--tRNA ligase [bacterium]|nr:valine--tRNA ligase [bacterium]
MDKSYKPEENEKNIYEKWEKGGYFTPKLEGGKKPFTVVIPPPNVTGSLHMGHALNNTIQDTLVRWNRMKGIPAEWLPGTDHAGIATQSVVEKKLAKEGKTRFDLGRANFEKEVWKWKDEYEARILGQLKTLGCSCDWSRTRFTMDEGYTKAILKAFTHYYDKGYIYRDYRITNWCPRCGTSLSDLEVEHEEHESFLWYIKYEIEGGGELTVATTRPETMLGDTAVAVNPKDKRYTDLIGKNVILPIQGRKIPIITDDIVDMEFGTGAVKVTPAHDPNDFEIAKRHKLDKIIVIDLEGKMTPEAGEEFAGLDRFEARDVVIEMLKEGKWLSQAKPYIHNVGHCYRCNTIMEPSLTLQWYVSMKELAKPAIKAVKDGEVEFHPKKWKKVYLDWMNNINDWCISRQIWWGHQIPVWYCECGEIIVSEKWAMEDVESKKSERKCPKCKSSKLKRDEDVLDTWFSSALWPFATFGWPEKTKDLDYFYPTTFLATARDILYLWVARIIMSGIEFMGEVPFKDVYINPTVFNSEGRRMSKSLGTGVDPLELIEKYGTDATRFGLLWQIGQGQDIKFSEDAILNGKRFANKVWNATRFTLMNLEDYKDVSRETFEKEIKPSLTKNDKEILKKLNQTIETTNNYLGKYDFQHAIEVIYDFFWHDFCDNCIEDTKVRIRENDKSKLAAQYTLDVVLKNSLKLLHPIMPFVTESIWENLDEKEPLIISKWPEKIEF